METRALDLIKVGQIVYIEDFEGQSWPFGVNNILNGELVVCLALGRKSTPLNINSTNTVTIVVPEENGAYMIRSKIDENDETKSRLVLHPHGNVSFIQRRQYFRISKPSVLVHYQLMEKDSYETILKPVEAMVWDLSGNGIGMVVRGGKTIYANTKIKLTVSLPGQKPIVVVGEVMRVLPKSIIKNEYLLGVNFKNIRESDRDRIVKYITQEQLQLRRLKKRA